MEALCKDGHVNDEGMNRVTWIVSVVAVLVSACVPDPLEVDVRPAKPQIVVSSQIFPDSSVAVLLTKSIGGLDASDESDLQGLVELIALNDAEVTITINDTTYTLELFENGLYQTTEIPLKVGSECHLNVLSKSLGEVSASTVVQAPISFDTVSAGIYFNGVNEYLAEVTYALQDPFAENYYMLNVQGAKPREIIENIINPEAYTRLVDDKQFDGQKFSEKFLATRKSFYSGDTIAVSLANVSPDYYKYVRMRIENQLGLVELISEPIQYPTNIKGGKGFFNLHIPDIRMIVLP